MRSESSLITICCAKRRYDWRNFWSRLTLSWQKIFEEKALYFATCSFFRFFLHTKFRKMILILLLKTQKTPFFNMLLESCCLIVVKDAVKFWSPSDSYSCLSSWWWFDNSRPSDCCWCLGPGGGVRGGGLKTENVSFRWAIYDLTCFFLLW